MPASPQSRAARHPRLRVFLLAALFALLASCATSGGPLVSPGPNSAGSKLSIQSDMEWTRFSDLRMQVWTMDGLLLNRLFLIPGVREREYIFLGARQTRRRPDGPFFRSGMRADELRDLVADGLAASGAVNIQSKNLRPAQFGAYEGLRFEMDMANEEGLKYQAMVAAFEHDKQLALAIFLAPSEYYYSRDAARIDRMLSTLRWNEARR